MPTAAELKTRLKSFDWDAWQKKITAAVQPSYEVVARDQAAREAERYDLEFDEADPFLDKWFTDYLGEEISGINDVTRERIQDILHSSIEDGTTDHLAQMLQDTHVFSPARANTIARTETATAYGHGAGLLYRQNGIEHVEISDGDEDDECAEADGQIWTVDEYLDEPIAHPNCVRSAAPIVEDEETDE